MYQAGEKRVIQCNIRDITDQQRAQQAISDLNAKLQQRVIERTEKLEAFSYSVSHDLRAPLRHLVGYVELLGEDLGTPLPEKITDHLTKISRAAQRMTNLIDDLLALARTERSEVKRTKVDLGVLVKEILEDFRDETKGRIIAWTIHPLPTIQADRGLLRLALINLISNAIKFTGHRAEAAIEMGSALNSDSKEAIYIRDNGAGFDPGYSEKLFGVFQRLHSEEEFEGTGIGLANVQSIIHRHGGQVWAEGNVNAGATFYFTIPE
jgi:light-regulated signal transduction histidine kinase (bacteriophytochrome)